MEPWWVLLIIPGCILPGIIVFFTWRICASGGREDDIREKRNGIRRS